MSAISTCLSRCPVEVLRLGRGTVGRHVQGFLGLHTASNAALCSFTARIVACAPARPPDRLEGGAGDRLAQFDPVAVVVARTVRRGGGAARRRTTARRHLSGPASRSDEDRPQPQGLRQLLRRRAQPPAGLPALLAPDPDGAAHHPVPQIVSRPNRRPGSAASTCHLDPYLDEAARPNRRPGWRGALGQVAAAQAHLANQRVGAGDVFLFWGLFRPVERRRGRWRYAGPAIHAAFGWIQVGEIVRHPAGPAARARLARPPPPRARGLGPYEHRLSRLGAPEPAVGA
jgi:hypothetical protein